MKFDQARCMLPDADCVNVLGKIAILYSADRPPPTMAKKKRIPHKFQPWIDARKKYRLSNAHIQMARELGLSPKRFSQYSDIKDQPWKKPLPQFIESLYEKQFGKNRPDEVMSMEDIAAAHVAKRASRKNRQRAEAVSEPPVEAASCSEELALAEETLAEESPAEESPPETPGKESAEN